MGMQCRFLRKICQITFCQYVLYVVSETLYVPCDPGWTLYPGIGTCLKVFDTAMPWYNARMSCRVDGGDMIRIVDRKMDKFVLDFINKSMLPVYIGLKIQNKEMQWLDDPPLVGYANEKVMKSKHLLNCGVIHRQIVWGNKTKPVWGFTDCENENRFICQKGQALCPKNWLPSSPSLTCIKLFVEERMDYGKARKTCQNKGGDLVVIQNEEMNTFLHDQFVLNKPRKFNRRSVPMEYYVGLTDPTGTFNYQWNDNPGKPNFTSWDTGQPNVRSQKCTMLHCVARSKPMGWHDIQCILKKEFICEMLPVCTATDRGTASGMLCPVNCSETNCLHKHCNNRDGICFEGCEKGFADSKCDFALVDRCPSFCKNKTCDERTGVCLEGCYDGFIGPQCDEYKDVEFSIDFTEVIRLGSICVMLILPFVFVLACLLEFNRSSPEEAVFVNDDSSGCEGEATPPLRTSSIVQPQRVSTVKSLRTSTTSDASKVLYESQTKVELESRVNLA